MVKLEGLTKRFPNGHGVFDLDLELADGEIVGYLGPNGAGKTTTIRLLMGFLRQDSGHASIDGRDCSLQSVHVQELVGYLPGEIGFPEDMTGHELLDLLASMRRPLDTRVRRLELLHRFDLDADEAIRKMSKGTKQKLALVAALMHRPRVLILDEPTAGLDPLMQERFLELMQEEKQAGTTALMSSHMFSEVERACDRVAMIRDGRVIAVEDMARLRSLRRQIFTVTVGAEADLRAIEAAGCTIVARRGRELDLEVHGDYNHFVRTLATCDVRMLDVRPLNLEQIFLHLYGTEEAHTL